VSDDIKILYNDWPYGVDEEIVHLVVWTKFDLEDDPATDDLTPKARKDIDDFVDRIFCSKVPPQNVGDESLSTTTGHYLIFSQVIWFKNWRSLKSVHAVEHFHVMLYDPGMAFIKQITRGDIPLSEKVQ